MRINKFVQYFLTRHLVKIDKIKTIKDVDEMLKGVFTYGTTNKELVVDIKDKEKIINILSLIAPGYDGNRGLETAWGRISFITYLINVAHFEDEQKTEETFVIFKDLNKK